MKKISEHISYKEATYSHTAKSFGISNKPEKEHLEAMKFDVVDPGLKVQFVPDNKCIEACQELGKIIARALPSE